MGKILQSALGSIGSMVLYFLATVILARILSPHEFGVMAIISVLVGLSGIFFENTLGAALVHVEKTNDRYSGSVFALAMLLGAALAGLMILLARPVADYFGMAELDEISGICSVVFLFNAFQVVPYALLQREGNFMAIGRAELFATMAGAVSAIGAAFNGLGIWSLAALLLVTSMAKAILFRAFAGRPVMACLDRASIKEIWAYCSGLLGANTFNYLATTIDQLLVGKLFGAASLGAYRLATQLATLPQLVLSLSANRVFFPRYMQAGSESQVREIHLQLLSWTALISYPLLVGMAVTSKDVIHVIFGTNWNEVPHMMAILSISALLPVLGAMNLPVFLYKGETRLQFRMTLITRGIYIAGLLIGAAFGIEGMLYGILLARLVSFHIAFSFAGGLIGLPVRNVLTAIRPAFVASLIMGGGLWISDVFAGAGSSWMSLSGQVALGAILYGVSYRLVSDRPSHGRAM